ALSSAGDPKEKALLLKAYHRVSDEFKNKITDPDLLALYNRNNERYAAASGMDKSIFNRKGDLTIENQVMGYEAGRVNTDFADVNSVLKNVQALEDAQSGTVGTATGLQKDISKLSARTNQAKTLEPVTDPKTG